MKNINHKSVILTLLLLIIAVPGFALAFSLTDVTNTAKNLGMGAVESKLGLHTSVGTPPSNYEQITVPAGEQFLVYIGFTTNGTTNTGSVCSTTKVTGYNKATSPASVTYNYFGSTGSLAQADTPVSTTGSVTTYYAGSYPTYACPPPGVGICGGGCKTESTTNTYVVSQTFKYSATLTVPPSKPDGTYYMTVTVTPDSKNTVSNLSTSIPNATVSGNTITIPVRVYTPLRETFQLKKWKQP